MKFEFSHDTIAKVINDKASADLKIRRQIRSLVERAHQRYLNKGVLLTKADLEEIRPLEKQIDFSKEQSAFIKQSKRVISRKRRFNQLLVTTFIASLIIALFMVLQAQRKAVASEQDARAANEGLNAANANLDQKIKELNQTNTSLAKAQTTLIERGDSLSEAIKLSKQNELNALKAKNEALFQKSRAVKQENIAEARRLASLAQLLGNEGKLNDALKMNALAYRQAPYPQPKEVYQSFLNVWLEDEKQSVPKLMGGRPLTIPDMYQFCLSPTGDTLAVALYSGKFQLIDKYGELLQEGSRFEGYYNELIFSKNGEYVFAKGDKQNSLLWSIKDNRWFTDLGENRIKQGVFSESSKLLGLVVENSVFFYKTDTGEKIEGALEFEEKIASIQFSPDDTQVVVIDTTGKTFIWKFGDKDLITLDDDRTKLARFATDGQSFYAITSNGDVIKYSLQGNVLANTRIAYGNSDLIDIQCSSNNAFVAVLVDWGEIMIFSSELDKIKSIKNIITDEIRFSNDGKYIWANSYEGTYKLNFNDEEILLVPFESYITNNLIAPNDSYVLTIGEKKQLSFWEPSPSPFVTLQTKGEKVEILDAQFSLKGNYVFFENSEGIPSVWNRKDESLREFNANDEGVYTSTFYSSNNSIFTSSYRGDVIWWEIDEHKKKQVFKHTGFVYDSEFLPNQEKVITASDSIVRVWNLEAEVIDSITLPNDIYLLEVLPDDNIVLCLTYDDGLFLWNMASKSIRKISLGNSENLYLFVPPTNDYFITSVKDQSFSIWNLKGQLIKKVSQSSGMVNLKFSNDGQYFVVDDVDDKVTLWTKKGKLIWSEKIEKKGVTFTKILEGEKRIMIGYLNGTIDMLNFKGQLITSFIGHKNGIYDVALSNDGSKVLSCASDETAKLWTIDGQLLADFVGHESRVYNARFSPDEKWIVTASADGTARIWPMPSTYVKWIEDLDLPPFTEEEKKIFGIE